MDLVDEQDVAVIEVRQQRGKIARSSKNRTRGHPEPHSHLGCDDPGEGGLAETWGACEEQVIHALAALASGLEHDGQVLFELSLPHEFLKGAWPQGRIEALLPRQGVGRDIGFTVGPLAGQHVASRTHATPLPRVRSARRSAAPTSISPGISSVARLISAGP